MLKAILKFIWEAVICKHGADDLADLGFVISIIIVFVRLLYSLIQYI